MARRTAARNRPQREAHRVWRTWGSGEVPVDVEAIAERIGIEVLYRDLEEIGDDVSGLLYVDREETSIFVEIGQPPVRQRFTIAHELGHFFLHNTQHVLKGPMYIERSGVSSTGTKKQEIEANQFAAELLMPRDVIEDRFGCLSYVDEDDIEELAEEFNVSIQAMAIRLSSLGYLG